MKELNCRYGEFIHHLTDLELLGLGGARFDDKCYEAAAAVDDSRESAGRADSSKTMR